MRHGRASISKTQDTFETEERKRLCEREEEEESERERHKFQVDLHLRHRVHLLYLVLFFFLFLSKLILENYKNTVGVAAEVHIGKSINT